MITRSLRILIVIVACILAAGVILGAFLKVSLVPRNLAGHLVSYDGAPRFLVKDIDLDGQDEVFLLGLKEEDKYVKWVSPDLGCMTQLNLTEDPIVTAVTWADADLDGRLELGMPHMESDSFVIQYYSFAESGHSVSKRIAFAQGNPGGDGRWDGFYRAVGMLDANDDGVEDVIFHAHTNYDYQPRALIAYDVSGDSIIWQYGFGTAIEPATIDDYNGDGQSEILLGSHAFSNGPPEGVNGTDDLHSYVVMLDRHGKLLWQREMGGLFSSCTVYGCAYADDDHPNIFALVTPSNTGRMTEEESLAYQYGRIVSLSGGDGRVVKERILGNQPDAYQRNVGVEGGLDPELGILTRGNDGRLRMYDLDLDLARQSRSYAGLNIQAVKDFDGDGCPEILITTADREFRLLNKYLQEVVFYSTGGETALEGELIRRTPGGASRLVLTAGVVRVFEIPELPSPSLAGIYWWLSEYATLIGLAAGLLLGLPLLAYLRQKALFSRVLILASEAGVQVGSGVIGLDNGNGLIYANQTAQRLLDLPRQWRWKKLADLLPGEEGGKLSQRLSEMRSQRPRDEDSVLPVRTGAGLKFLGLSKAGDCTTLRETVTLFSITDSQKKSTQQMVTDWYDLSSRIAHRIKTPITNALRSVELAEGALRLVPEADADELGTELDNAKQFLRESVEMTERFLRFRLKDVDLQEHVLADLLQEAVDYALLPIDICLDYVIDVEDPEQRINTDKELFRELFTLLIQNAAEAMDPSEAKLVMAAKLAWNVREKSTGQEQIVVTVKDNGHGIAQDNLVRVFEPFYTTKFKSGGSGLGLAMASRICELLNADISIESVVSRGTEVTVSFGASASTG